MVSRNRLWWRAHNGFFEELSDVDDKQNGCLRFYYTLINWLLAVNVNTTEFWCAPYIKAFDRVLMHDVIDVFDNKSHCSQRLFHVAVPIVIVTMPQQFLSHSIVHFTVQEPTDSSRNFQTNFKASWINNSCIRKCCMNYAFYSALFVSYSRTDFFTVRYSSKRKNVVWVAFTVFLFGDIFNHNLTKFG